MNKKTFLLGFLILTSLFLTGCSLSIGSSGVKITGIGDGGVFLSTNKGSEWKSMSLVPSVSGKPGSLSNNDITVIAIDPNDHNTLYANFEDDGLWMTTNIASGWQQIKSLPRTMVSQVAIDPNNKCVIYAALGNTIQKSIDCARSFKEIYQDNNPEVVISALVIDWENSRNIYIGNSRGDIVKSIDGGVNWRTIKRIEQKISSIIISPKNSGKLFIADGQGNVYSFLSDSKTNPNNSEKVEQNFSVDDWQDFSSILKSLNTGSSFRDLLICEADATLFLATDKTISRSNDQGVTWENLTLLPPEKDAVIMAAAVSPKNSKDIYYVTNTSFFRSSDGGVSWTVKKLPTSRGGAKLVVDYQNPNIIYLGTKTIK